jgi:hypothetical protein
VKLTLTRYRLSLPLKDGLFVAARSPLEAVRLFLPHADLKEGRSGPKWVRFEILGGSLPPTWPRPNPNGITGEGGTIVEVEDHGPILVALDPEEVS